MFEIMGIGMCEKKIVLLKPLAHKILRIYKI